MTECFPPGSNKLYYLGFLRSRPAKIHTHSLYFVSNIFGELSSLEIDFLEEVR